MGMDKFLETHGIHLEREDDDFEPSAKNERSIQEKQQNLRKINTKSSCQAMTLDTFLETNEIHVEGEEKHSGANANKVGDDDDDDFSDDEDYVSEYEDAVLHGDDNHLMETNNVEGVILQRLEGHEEKQGVLKSMQESKFILPKEGKEWVMTGVREVWKGYKTRIKGKHFEIYNNIENMLKNRPLDIPEALSRLNSENRKKQQHQHRMRPISFAKVHNKMHEMNENKEDPSQVDMFVATRTGQKEKELDSGTQAVILSHNKLKINLRATKKLETLPRKPLLQYLAKNNEEEFDKEREIAKIKQQHAETINSMKTELHEIKDRVQSLEDLVKLLFQQSSLGTNIDEALSLLRAKESTHDINSKQCLTGNDRPSSSTRDPK
ncbi:uncharacterized protein LOC130962655 [Arachis stenosperma]|uniref:uncharacterized protein LOC130962655 n=1 Tax=Arachis stenosperma TaxID=217475 RepID=UPI0025AB9A84|nr:uncharacterized protein LOC130962655 [Arachis stenosperma]